MYPMDVTNGQIKRALVTISIERVLLEMGKPVFDEVVHALHDKYNCYVPDCFDHPEYLKEVLEELYGNSYKNIIKSIHKHLDEFANQKPIEEFLKAISE
jgi:hypothetical protein